MYKYYIIMIVTLLTFFGCKSDDENDPIKLSEKDIECDYKENYCTVSTGSENWWFQKYVEVNGQHIPVTDLKTTYKDNNSGLSPLIIEGEWFRIAREGTQQIVVHLKENKTKERRTLKILIQEDDYLDRVEIIQKMK